jgi:hypothetical protein
VILLLALKLLLTSLIASSLFVLWGFLHQRRKAKCKKLAAMTGTRFAKITPDDLFFETGGLEFQQPHH